VPTGLRHVVGWLCAASMATGMTWVAIRDVLDSTGLGVPDSVRGAAPGGGTTLIDPAPVATTVSPRTGGSDRSTPTVPAPSATSSPRGTAAASATAPAPPSAPGPSATAADGPRATSSSPAEQQDQQSASTVVRSYTLEGGHAVLEIGADRAELVSATPRDGFQVQSWTQVGWLRVEFTSDNDHSSLFATWNGHAPEVRVVEY